MLSTILHPFSLLSKEQIFDNSLLKIISDYQIDPAKIKIRINWYENFSEAEMSFYEQGEILEENILFKTT